MTSSPEATKQHIQISPTRLIELDEEAALGEQLFSGLPLETKCVLLPKFLFNISRRLIVDLSTAEDLYDALSKEASADDDDQQPLPKTETKPTNIVKRIHPMHYDQVCNILRFHVRNILSLPCVT